MQTTVPSRPTDGLEEATGEATPAAFKTYGGTASLHC